MAVVIEVAAAVAAAAGGSSDMILKPGLALLLWEILICRAVLNRPHSVAHFTRLSWEGRYCLLREATRLETFDMLI